MQAEKAQIKNIPDNPKPGANENKARRDNYSIERNNDRNG
jgi:hypothetical protein